MWLNALVRYTYLDLVRGLAASAVLVFHYAGFFQAPVAAPQLPWHAVLWPFYEFGGYAVQVFWLLSGIVFLTAYQNPVTGREFFLRRFARLYPLHFVTLIAMVVLDQINRALNGSPLLPANDAGHFVLQLFMASNWLGEHPHSFNAPIWSVSMEVLAYLVFFVALRMGWTSLLSVCAIAFVFTLLALLTASYTLTCIALFFIGAVVAHLPRVLGKWLPLVAACALGVAVMLALAVGHSTISRHTGLVITYAAFPAVLLAVLAIDLRAPPVTKRLRWIGESTYAVYLLHIPVQTTMLLGMRWVGLQVPAAEPWLLVLYAGSVIWLAKVVYKRFEAPAQRAVLAWLLPLTQWRQAVR